MEETIMGIVAQNGAVAVVAYILLKYILSASDRRDKSYLDLLASQTDHANTREERLYLQIEKAQAVYEEQLKANFQQTEIMSLIKAELFANSQVLAKIAQLVEK